MNWYKINNIERIDTPCLVLYKERIRNNIEQAIKRIKNPDNLRPHVKTNKIPEVCRMMMDAGITKFKCATIAEAEMLAIINAPDVGAGQLRRQPIQVNQHACATSRTAGEQHKLRLSQVGRGRE